MDAPGGMLQEMLLATEVVLLQIFVVIITVQTYWHAYMLPIDTSQLTLYTWNTC